MLEKIVIIRLTLNIPLAQRRDKLWRAVTFCLLIRFIS